MTACMIITLLTGKIFAQQEDNMRSTMPAGLIFRIQVAASRTPMTREQLARIYPGPYAVEMIEEEGWYKYQLLGIRLYSDALSIIKDIPVNGIFISAYEDGIKTDLYQGVLKNHSLERSVKSYGRKTLSETEYHVQVAASRYPLEHDTLLQFYSGSDPVSLIIEDKWYKYHIKAGNSHDLANLIKERCGVNNANIIPYKRGLRISMPALP